MTDACEKAAFFRKCTAVRNNRISVHLQLVVIVEAKRLIHADTFIQLEACRFQTLSGTRVAGIEDRHIVLFSQFIDRRKKTCEIL